MEQNQTIDLKLTIDEINVILEGLGGMPFVKVHRIIGKIQQQAGEQLSGTEDKPA